MTALRRRLSVDCQFLATGIGEKRTRKALEARLHRDPPELLIYTGTAGQLDPALKMGEILLPEEWCLEDGPCLAVDALWAGRLRAKGWEVAGRGLTVRMPVVRAKTRSALHQRYAARICDMEAAVALDVAAKYAVPCLAPKVISDTAASGLLAYWTQFEENMDRLAGYLKKLIQSL